MFLTATISSLLDKERLDVALVKLKLVNTRQIALSTIISGKVFIDDKKILKAGTIVKKNSLIKVRKREYEWVSRGGLKLSPVLKKFKIILKNKICLDIGSSTGGFTDVLLKEGALRVYCVDVGYGQLAWKIRNDKRVVVLEKTNARYLNSNQINQPVQVLVCDVSFISIKKIIPACLRFLSKDAYLIVLIKPQFEAGRENISKGGIIKDDKIHKIVCDDIKKWFIEKLNKEVISIIESSIKGQKGNKEFFILAKN